MLSWSAQGQIYFHKIYWQLQFYSSSDVLSTKMIFKIQKRKLDIPKSLAQYCYQTGLCIHVCLLIEFWTLVSAYTRLIFL
jgi:hypothetical protein